MFLVLICSCIAEARYDVDIVPFSVHCDVLVRYRMTLLEIADCSSCVCVMTTEKTELIAVECSTHAPQCSFQSQRMEIYRRQWD